jgi:Sec-independent protein translocase protein TatA
LSFVVTRQPQTNRRSFGDVDQSIDGIGQAFSENNKGMKTTWLQDIGYLIEVVCTQEIQVKGYLYTVDPNTNNLILLNDYDPTTTKFHQLTLVMGSAIQEMKRLQETEEPELTNRIRQTDKVEQLLVQQHTTETTQVSSAIEQRRNKLLELLNKVKEKVKFSHDK